MTDKEKRECPDLYRRLKLASLRAGESIGDTRVWRDDTAKRMARWCAK